MSPVSFNPEHFSQGGGLLDDFDGEITDARIDIFSYQGKGKPTVALILDIETDDGEKLEQAYSIGDEKRWSPSHDNKEIVGNDNQESINDSCNAALFLNHLVDAGFPADQLESGDVSVMEGLVGHFKRVPQPKRSGLSGGDGKERTILTVSDITQLPGEKKSSRRSSRKSSTTKTSSRSSRGSGRAASKSNGSEGGDMEDTASALVMEVLADKGEATKKELSAAAFKTIKDMTERKAVVKLVFSEDFLDNPDQPWDYDKGVVSIS